MLQGSRDSLTKSVKLTASQSCLNRFDKLAASRNAKSSQHRQVPRESQNLLSVRGVHRMPLAAKFATNGNDQASKSEIRLFLR
jgi:hypothetical protein